jgi:hypothetical protein
MRKYYYQLSTVGCFICVFMFMDAFKVAGTVSAEGLTQDNPPGSSFYSAPVCLPDLYLSDPGACLAYGPSETIADLAEMGFPYPLRDIPAAPPDASLSEINANIARINLDETEPAPLYANFEDAVAEANPTRSMAPGVLRYVSYIYRSEYEGKTYLQLASGEWLRASPVAYNKFQGLEFTKNPGNDFGWIVDEIPGYSAPSFGAPQTGNIHYRTDLVQIYQTVEAETVYWYQISPGEWVNSLKTRKVHFDPTPPAGISTDRWISLDLFQQTMVVYEGGDLKFATLMASGLEPFYTQPGTFQIYKKLLFETMTTGDLSDFYYLQDVPWTMYFDQSRAIHGSYWRTFYGYPQSHGCINLSPGDANWVFQWANEGDWVYAFDPSGRTPTDPALYGPGAP